jgi:PAS domain S-box-containing protein
VSVANGAPGRLGRPRRRFDVQGQPEHLSEEIKRLQRCINDLVGVLALPAIGSRSDPSQIVRILFDVLLGMLHLDFVYVKLTNAAGDAPIEMLRVAESRTIPARPQEVGEALGRWLGPDPLRWVRQRGNPFDNGDISIVPSPLGLQGEIGVVVAGSSRPDFPAQAEKLLLSVATNQAAIGLQEARLLGEQKRLADELDQRVARRTSELAAANDQLRLQVGLLQQIPVAAWTLGPEGTPDFVNQSWLQYTGQSLDYVRSGPEAWMSAIHPEDREGASRSFWDGICSGQGFTMETRFRREHDGTYRWHLNRAVGLRDAEGKILKFVGTSTDIEDLKQSQENLQKAEEKTRLIIDSTLDAVIAIDAKGMITSWNKQAEVVFGWSSREAIGQHMADMIIPVQERRAHERGLRHFLASGEGPILRRRIEVTAVRRSGIEFPVELEIVPMRLGQDWHFNAFIHDITDSKLAAEKLRESELNLRQLTETIPEMLWSATPEGAIDYCNARVLDYTGFTAEEIMGGSWIKLLHPDDVEQTVRVWMSCVATGTAYRVEVRTLHAADHTYRWCVTSALPLLDEQGRIVKWYGTIVDMHDWKQAQEDLRNTQAELAHMMRVMTAGELTASIAHEVNQPLSGIITNAGTCLRMLAADPPNVEGARETARRTLRDGNRASDVITRLRALFGKKGVTAEAVDLNEATREVIALSLSELERCQVILRTELSDDLPPVTGDRIQLQQVILNLVLNASDAMRGVADRPRLLHIRTAREDKDCVRVSVQDTGVGFEPQSADRLFEAFYTTKSSGMGIGLSVSRSIIENHQGRLWGASNEGAGATFSFYIPCGAEGMPGSHSMDAIRTSAMTDQRHITGHS